MMARHGSFQREKARVLIISDEQPTAEVWGYSLSRLGLDVTLLGITDPIDECLTFPITPRLFQVKVKAWLRRTMSIPLSVLNEIELDTLRLNVDKRILKLPTGDQVKLTNLESRQIETFYDHGCDRFCDRSRVR